MTKMGSGAWSRPVSDPGALNGDSVGAAEAVKRQALAAGADFVGIGNIERWKGAPLQMDPRQVMPECRLIIAMGFRVMRGSHTPFYRKPENIYYTGQAVCGSRGCTRACMMSLESRGVLGNRFKEKFRRRQPWNVDWSTLPPPVEQPATDWNQDAEVD